MESESIANEAETADHLRTIAIHGLSDDEFQALVSLERFKDEDDWRAPAIGAGPRYYCPLRFYAYLQHFKPKGCVPAECLEWRRPTLSEFNGWKERGVADYTYFALGKVTGAIKIGRSRHPEFRISSLKTERNGEPAQKLAIIPDGDLELPYHRVFARWRDSGEWFAPHPDILAEIERLTSPSTI